MKNLEIWLNKARYKLFGRQIQRQLMRAEEAGHEVASYTYESRVKDLEHDLEALTNKHEREIGQIVNKRLSELEYRFNPDDVLTASYGQNGRPTLIFLGKEELTDQEIANLKQEARLLKDTRIWKIVTETLRSQAQEIMFNKSKDYDDMRSGKLMLYNLGVIENIVATIENARLE